MTIKNNEAFWVGMPTPTRCVYIRVHLRLLFGIAYFSFSNS